MNSTLAQRAQLLAHELLLSTYEPSPGVPEPGSPAWDRAVLAMAKHLLYVFDKNKHLLIRRGPAPQVPQLGPSAVQATKTLLQRFAKGEA